MTAIRLIVIAMLTSCTISSVPTPPWTPLDVDAGTSPMVEDAGTVDASQAVADVCQHLCMLDCREWCGTETTDCTAGLQTLIDGQAIVVDLGCLAATMTCVDAADCTH